MLLNLPAGADTPSAPWNTKESTEVVQCGFCGHESSDVNVTWSVFGHVICPVCGTDIEVEPPERDWDWERDLRDDR